MFFVRIVFCVAMMICVTACNRNDGSKTKSNVKIVAKAGAEELDADHFAANLIVPGPLKDSAYNAKKIIDGWATESLFYQEAITKLNEEEIQIERQVAEYRKSLVNFIYQSKIVEANLDTVITWEEIQDYYDGHRDNFILRDNIVKVNYLKVPLKAPALPKIRKYLYSANPKDRQQLLDLSAQNAENFFLNDSTWLFLDDIKKEIPALREQPDINLGPGRVLEFQDEDYFYYLKVKDVKIKNGLSPINFERQNIKKFILNNRKTQLIKQYKQLLLEKAVSNKTYVRY